METTRRPSFVTVALNYLSYLFLFAVCAVMLILAWPSLQARISGTPAVPQVQPTQAASDTSEADALKARLAAVQAQLAAARAAQQSIIVQEVPPGAAPNITTVITPPAPTPDINTSGEQPAPAPRPIIIVHTTRADGTHQTITGSGACAVAAKGARRCGDK